MGDMIRSEPVSGDARSVQHEFCAVRDAVAKGCDAPSSLVVSAPIDRIRTGAPWRERASRERP